TVTLMDLHTHACLGDWVKPTAVDQEDVTHACYASTNGVTINAGNNVLIAARDDSKMLQITASLAGGYVGVGVAVGVAVFNKDTQAYIGQNSTINAKAQAGSALAGIYVGTVTSNGFGTTSSFHGLAVQTTASEDFFGLSASAGGGLVGGAGSVSVWPVGPRATKTYHDGAAGPDRGAWSSATASKTTFDTDGVTVIPDVAVRYHKGDVVTFGGKTYAARVDQPLDDPSHTTEWEGETDALAATPADKGDCNGGTHYHRGVGVK